MRRSAPSGFVRVEKERGGQGKGLAVVMDPPPYIALTYKGRLDIF